MARNATPRPAPAPRQTTAGADRDLARAMGQAQLTQPPVSHAPLRGETAPGVVQTVIDSMTELAGPGSGLGMHGTGASLGTDELKK
jgi:hypothetical protein